VVSVSQVIRQFTAARVLESSVVHPSLNYCGVVDCVAKLGDTLVLADWKTSEKIKNSTASLYDAPLQVAAYMGAINRDERYKELGNLTKGAVVVIYNSGYPALVHTFELSQMEKYWEEWCSRLDMYHNQGG
jgi:genome maintenance exonuclease 1